MGTILAATMTITSAAAGPYDGKIESLNGEITDNQAKIEVLQNEIEQIQRNADDLVTLKTEGASAVHKLEEDIAEAEAKIATESRELEILPIRIELLADLVLEHYLLLDEPTAVRHMMAIDSYVKNDERINTVLTQSAELTDEALNNLRTQMVYEAVIDSATEELSNIYARLRLDGDRALTLYDLLDESKTRHQAALSDRDTAIAAIPLAQGRITDSEDEIAIAEFSIKEAEAEIKSIQILISAKINEIVSLQELNVSKSWTGLQGLDISRPALAVKIDNAGAARPQTGINQADVVYEELVEAGMTRLIALFQTTSPGTVGPVRSARTSDPILLEGFDRPLFAYSGANRGTLEAIDVSPIVDVGYDSELNAYWRTVERRAPHNLYASTDQLWDAKSDRLDLSPPPFTYGWPGQPLPESANTATGVTIDFGQLIADYSWDGYKWLRSTNGSPHNDASGVRVAPTNVIVQFVEYGRSPADSRSPEAQTVGTGSAWVFTAGHLIVAEWQRSDPAQPALILLDGNPILLEPGNTWVALADASNPGNVSWR